MKKAEALSLAHKLKAEDPTRKVSVTWPTCGCCRTFNDVLIAHGAEAVKRMIEAAEPINE